MWQILESPDQVPESFYLSDEKTAQLIAKADFSKNQIGNLLETGSFGGNPQIGRVYNVEGTSPALNTMTGGGRVPKIAIPVLTPGRVGDQIANTLDTSCNQGVVVPVGNINPSGKGMNGNVYSDEGISPTLTTNKGEGVKVLQVGRGFNKGGVKDVAPALTKNSWQENNFLIDNIIWRIRKVMPIECFRLQSFPDWVFKAAEKVNSNSQLYKQAGNSVTVNIIEKIAKLFKEE